MSMLQRYLLQLHQHQYPLQSLHRRLKKSRKPNLRTSKIHLANRLRKNLMKKPRLLNKYL